MLARLDIEVGGRDARRITERCRRKPIGPEIQLPRGGPIQEPLGQDAVIDQRISFFEGGLIVVRLSGAGGTIQKRVIIPPDALAKYLETTTASSLGKIGVMELSPPAELRTARLRIYDGAAFVERMFDPTGTKPKRLQDQVRPLEDLLRAISEDREVTSSVTGYEPKVGDELVGDDRKIYRVERVIADSGIVQLRCVSQPTILYVAKKDLHNYFVGKPRAQ